MLLFSIALTLKDEKSKTLLGNKQQESSGGLMVNSVLYVHVPPNFSVSLLSLQHSGLQAPKLLQVHTSGKA